MGRCKWCLDNNVPTWVETFCDHGEPCRGGIASIDEMMLRNVLSVLGATPESITFRCKVPLRDDLAEGKPVTVNYKNGERFIGVVAAINQETGHVVVHGKAGGVR